MNKTCMRAYATRLSAVLSCCLHVVLAGTMGLAVSARGQYITNVQALVNRVPVGDPSLAVPGDGPKDIATADFDGDQKQDLAISNTDGTVTILFGKGDGQFEPGMHLHTGLRPLRAVIAADLNGDGRP